MPRFNEFDCNRFKGSGMVETLPLLDRLLHPVECYDAFDELDTLSRESPLDASAIAWNYLMKVDPWLSDMGIDALVVKVFLESTPDGSERLLAEWPQIDESPKRAICYGAYLAEAMPESLVVTLFFAHGSGVSERHLLVAGLASTAEARRCERTIARLIDQVGAYPPHFEHRQESLNGLRNDLRKGLVRDADGANGTV